VAAENVGPPKVACRTPSSTGGKGTRTSEGDCRPTDEYEGGAAIVGRRLEGMLDPIDAGWANKACWATNQAEPTVTNTNNRHRRRSWPIKTWAVHPLIEMHT
jgi:hypothetical protein